MPYTEYNIKHLTSNILHLSPMKHPYPLQPRAEYISGEPNRVAESAAKSNLKTICLCLCLSLCLGLPVTCQTTDQGTSQALLSSPNLSSTQFMRPALSRSILDGLKYNLFAMWI
jgi:hypothetical protein